MARKPPIVNDRIKELRRVRAGDLSPCPRNWRTHPKAQVDALRGIIAEIGYADALLARELPDGTLELVDGHARQALDPDQVVPVLVLDLDQGEAHKLMAVLDPLAAMAQANNEALGSLLEEIETGSEGVQVLLDSLASSIGAASGGDTELVELDLQKPPAMAWVLIGVPTVLFASISSLVEAAVSIDGAVVHTTQNDG